MTRPLPPPPVLPSLYVHHQHPPHSECPPPPTCIVDSSSSPHADVRPPHLAQSMCMIVGLAERAALAPPPESATWAAWRDGLLADLAGGRGGGEGGAPEAKVRTGGQCVWEGTLCLPLLMYLMFTAHVPHALCTSCVPLMYLLLCTAHVPHALCTVHVLHVLCNTHVLQVLCTAHVPHALCTARVPRVPLMYLTCFPHMCAPVTSYVPPMSHVCHP